MSLLSNFVVTPGRIQGMYRFLAGHEEGVPEPVILQAMMPPSQTNEDAGEPRNIVSSTLIEGERIGLWRREDDCVVLTTGRPGATGNDLRTVIESHLWTHSEANADLAYAVAWLLSHDPVDGAWTEKRVESEMVATRWADETGITRKGKYGAFRDWTMYLGFGWQLKHEGSPGLMPDPTAYLRRRLPNIFSEPGKEIRFAQFMDALAGICPVFEGGQFRKDIDQANTSHSANHISASTGFALERLEREGRVTIQSKADDPDPRVLKRGPKTTQVSHITWYPSRTPA